MATAYHGNRAAGLKVLVLEQHHTVGGMTVTEEETPSRLLVGHSCRRLSTGELSPVPQEPGILDRYELIEPEIPFSRAFPDGGIISVHCDIEKTGARYLATPQGSPEHGAT